jgi:hypothetical protein
VNKKGGVKMTECKHDRVYANYSLASNPPKTPWICKLCGEKGMHVPITNLSKQDTYESLLIKFNK